MDKILSVTVVGEHAGELLSEFILAMKHGIGLNKILATIHPYPTWNEAVKYTAGNWKRAHVPVRVLAWLRRFHAFQLGRRNDDSSSGDPAYSGGSQDDS